MLIKNVTKDGLAIPLSPQEALKHAIAAGLSQKNNSEFVFRTTTKPVVSSFTTHPQDGGGYEAFGEGTCTVGKTRLSDDAFFVEKTCKFKIHYASAKDAIGAPSLAVNSFSYDEVKSAASSGPAKDQEITEAYQISSKLMDEEEKNVGGKVSTKYAKR